MNRRLAVLVCVTFLLLLVSLSGCSSGSTPTMNAATVQVTMSDPATCSGPQGVYSNVFVTVTDVKAHTNPSAGPNDSGWVDLTPNLQGAPMQIDLLSAADNTCVLARLGSVSQLPPGNYQQIRLYLLDNNQASALQGPNGCAPLNAVNCVVLQSDGSKHVLQLSSEAQTGIKIPSGQIAGGQFTVPAGQTVDINVNIDFNTCQSIVVQGNGIYRLLPVLHAGQLSTTASSIKGVVVDSVTGQPITGGKVIVALEQAGAACNGAGCTSGNAPIDRIVMEVVPDSGGNFTFCPVPGGTYDVVAAATGTSGGNPVAYAATVTTGVAPGTNIGTIKLIPQPTTLLNPSTAPATIKGNVTASPNDEIVSVSALQSFGSGLFTLPLTVGASTIASVTTSSGTGTYDVSVPAMNASVGPVNGPYVQNTQNAATYTMDAVAGKCTPSEAQTNTLSTNSPLTVTPGVESDASTIALTFCTP